jgi:hypothetical protein
MVYVVCVCVYVCVYVCMCVCVYVCTEYKARWCPLASQVDDPNCIVPRPCHCAPSRRNWPPVGSCVDVRKGRAFVEHPSAWGARDEKIFMTKTG